MNCKRHIPTNLIIDNEPFSGIMSTDGTCTVSHTVIQKIVCEHCGCEMTDEMVNALYVIPVSEPWDAEAFKKKQIEEWKEGEKNSNEPRKRWHYRPFSHISYMICEPTVIAKTKGGALLKIMKECPSLKGENPHEIWWKRFAYSYEK